MGGFGPFGVVMSDSWYSGVLNLRYSGLETLSRGVAVFPVKMDRGIEMPASESADGANVGPAYALVKLWAGQRRG